jgi:hypothetical protein
VPNRAPSRDSGKVLPAGSAIIVNHKEHDLAPSFLSEALREPLGSLLTSEGAVREPGTRVRVYAEDCSSVCPALAGYPWPGQDQEDLGFLHGSPGERKETLTRVRGGAPASEGNGGAMAYIIEISFIRSFDSAISGYLS